MTQRCVLLLGGSFDPVHCGHVAIARYFCTLLHPDELRLIPAGQPWQKPTMITPAEHRVSMLRLAFSDWMVPAVIDTQEVARDDASYAVDTLRVLRDALGQQVTLVMLLGADQLLNLHTWRDWRALFDLANLCVAARPGFALDKHTIDDAIAGEFARRRATESQVRDTPHGLTYIANDLAMSASSTAVRKALADHDQAALARLIPLPVLDYAQQHHLYQTAR